MKQQENTDQNANEGKHKLSSYNKKRLLQILKGTNCKPKFKNCFNTKTFGTSKKWKTAEGKFSIVKSKKYQVLNIYVMYYFE